MVLVRKAFGCGRALVVHAGGWRWKLECFNGGGDPSIG